MSTYPDLFREFALWINASGDQVKSVNISSKSSYKIELIIGLVKK